MEGKEEEEKRKLEGRINPISGENIQLLSEYTKS